MTEVVFGLGVIAVACYAGYKYLLKKGDRNKRLAMTHIAILPSIDSAASGETYGEVKKKAAVAFAAQIGFSQPAFRQSARDVVHEMLKTGDIAKRVAEPYLEALDELDGFMARK